MSIDRLLRPWRAVYPCPLLQLTGKLYRIIVTIMELAISVTHPALLLSVLLDPANGFLVPFVTKILQYLHILFIFGKWSTL